MRQCVVGLTARKTDYVAAVVGGPDSNQRGRDGRRPVGITGWSSTGFASFKCLARVQHDAGSTVSARRRRCRCRGRGQGPVRGRQMTGKDKAGEERRLNWGRLRDKRRTGEQHDTHTVRLDSSATVHMLPSDAIATFSFAFTPTRT